MLMFLDVQVLMERYLWKGFRRCQHQKKKKRKAQSMCLAFKNPKIKRKEGKQWLES